MREGVEGLLRYKSNPPGKTSVPPKRVAEIVRPHAETPPHEVTHWTARAMNECPVPRGAPRSGLAAFYQLQPKTPTPVINPSVSCTGANGDLRSRWVSCHSAASKGAKGRFRHMLTFIMMHSNVAVCEGFRALAYESLQCRNPRAPLAGLWVKRLRGGLDG